MFFAETERKRFRHATFSPAVSVMGEAAESIWRRVNMAIVESSLRFTTIVHESFMFSFNKSLFTLEFQMPKGQIVSRLLATIFKILVANTQSLIALATSESQFRTLIIYNFIWNGKDKVKRCALISDIENGGLKMLDIESMIH